MSVLPNELQLQVSKQVQTKHGRVRGEILLSRCWEEVMRMTSQPDPQTAMCNAFAEVGISTALAHEITEHIQNVLNTPLPKIFYLHHKKAA